MAAPLFSIIIPTLNEELFLPTLLVSLTEQSFGDFEVIVIDGSSADKTVAIASSFEKKLPRLEIIVSKIAGLPLQRNLGAKAARGSYFIFVDADSVLLPYTLSRIAWFIKRHTSEFFTSWFSPDSSVSGDALITLIGNLYVEGSVATKRPLSPGPLTVVSKKVYEKVGGYDETLTFGEDYDFTTRVVAAGVPLLVLRETLYSMSLRRMRREGKLKMIQVYAKAALSVILTKKNIRVPNYVMGGHLYAKKPSSKRHASFLRSLERKIKSLTREIFE